MPSNTPFFPPTPHPSHLQLHSSPTAVFSITKPPAAKRIQSVILAQLRRQHLVPTTFTRATRRHSRHLRRHRRHTAASATRRHPPTTTTTPTSTTPPLLPFTVTDATACVGGDTLHFATYFQHVHAIERDTTHYQMLQNNLGVYPDRSTRVTVHHGDALAILPTLRQEVVFMDPPWGGKSYKNKKQLQLTLSGKTLPEVVKQLWDDRKRAGTRCVVFKMPRNAGFGAFRKGVREMVGKGVEVRRVDLKMSNIVVFVVGW